MFSKHYQSELTYLRELGREFAHAHPSVMTLFAERGGDPDVERLLEGFAFLSARIRERVEDAVPEFIEALTQQLLPHYLRSIPSTSIVQFSPNLQALRSRQQVKAGTALASKKIDGTACQFHTTHAIDLLPLKINQCVLDDARESTPEIRLTLRSTEYGKAAVFEPNGIRFYLHGARELQAMLRLWFAQHLESIVLRDSSGKEYRLPASKLRVGGLDADEALWPWPRYATSAPRLVQEYFALSQKFMFLQLDGLEQINSEEISEEFTLHFRFDRPPALAQRLSLENFRLHCVPVRNIFEISGDPIRRDPRRHEYLLRAAGENPYHTEVYSVDSVVGIRDKAQGRTEYHAFHEYDHAKRSKNKQAYYTLRRCRSPIDGALDTYISFSTPLDVHPILDEETFSFGLHCTNRLLAGQLRVGDICVPTSTSPTVATFQNISEVTKPVPTPVGSELHWKLIAHLASSYRSLGEEGSLRKVLQLYNFQQDVDVPAGRANELRVSAIREVQMAPCRRVFQQQMVRGVQSVVTVDETAFAGIGDAHLFGETLNTFLGAQVPLNSFHVLRLQLHPSKKEFEWAPRSGSQVIL